MSQIALEKRMNEIRRLEGVKAELLKALERIDSSADTADVEDMEATSWRLLRRLELISQVTRRAIDAANASHPA